MWISEFIGAFEYPVEELPVYQPPNYAPATCHDPCPPACDRLVFDRVHVSYLISGGTRVMWDLVDDFQDPLPHTFTLQVGRTANQNADDWEDVGLPMENTFYAIDGEQRVWGKTQYTHYRIKLVTSEAIYYSIPTNGMGILSRRDWRLAREIIRKERLRNRLCTNDGYLLKRREFGPKCNVCLDFGTGEVLDPECPTCYGTGFQCGYFYPMGCVWADLETETKRKHIDNDGRRATISDIVVAGRMLMLPLIQEYDIWVNAKTDDRYYIHTIQNKAEMRSVPLIARVEMRPAPFTDVAYDIPIPQQIEAVS